MMQDLQYITITKSFATSIYISQEPMTYDFYLLYLLFHEKLTLPEDKSVTLSGAKKNIGINFCKSSGQQCLVTSQLFIHKNHGLIELFSMHDLKDNEELQIPTSPKFVMTTKNFINFMMQKDTIQRLTPQQFFIAIDNQGHAHITTDLYSIRTSSFFGALQKKLAGFFIKPT